MGSNHRDRKAFPAYAGMFPGSGDTPMSVRGFPRVCGDVSLATFLTSQIFRLSPRMRGCFCGRVKVGLTFTAFPAYAGMFPDRGI